MWAHIWAPVQPPSTFNFGLTSNFFLFTAHSVCGKKPKTIKIRGQSIKIRFFSPVPNSHTQMGSLMAKNSSEIFFFSHAWAPFRQIFQKERNIKPDFQVLFFIKTLPKSFCLLIVLNDYFWLFSVHALMLPCLSLKTVLASISNCQGFGSVFI